jgi:hypothetical protein
MQEFDHKLLAEVFFFEDGSLFSESLKALEQS